MFINYKNFENKVCDIIKFINKIIDIDIISYTRKLKSSLFKIDFNNNSKIIRDNNQINIENRKILYSLSILFLFEKLIKISRI